MDEKDHQLLKLLRHNARLSFAELGRKVRLTAPAVAERVRRMEDRGVIRGYVARVDRARLGRGLRVILRAQVPPREYAKFIRVAEALPGIEEAHHVTGAEAFIVKASLRDVAELEKTIEKFSAFGPTVTSVVLSTAFEGR